MLLQSLFSNVSIKYVMFINFYCFFIFSIYPVINFLLFSSESVFILDKKMDYIVSYKKRWGEEQPLHLTLCVAGPSGIQKQLDLRIHKHSETEPQNAAQLEPLDLRVTRPFQDLRDNRGVLLVLPFHNPLFQKWKT